MTDPNLPPASLSEEIEIPESISGLEPVRSVRSPIKLIYDFVPSPPVQEYLRSYSKKKKIKTENAAEEIEAAQKASKRYHHIAIDKLADAFEK